MLHIGRHFPLRPPRVLPTLVLDLDETLVHRRGVADAALMYVAPWVLVGRPYPGASAAVQSLAERFNVVAVTARWRLAEPSTDRMLASVGLAGLPTIFAARPHPGDASRVAFKARAIELLRERGWAPFAGVGDRPSDLRAYVRAGVAALMVAHASGGGGSESSARAQLCALRALESELRRDARASGGAEPRSHYFTDCADDDSGARLGEGAARDGGHSALRADGGAPPPPPPPPPPPVWSQVTRALATFAAPDSAR